jgi:hypothetical protein
MSRILSWVQRFRARFTGVAAPRFQVVRVAEMPEVLNVNTLYVIGASQPWSVALLCPCQCGEVIQLSLLAFDVPHWQLHLARAYRATLYPSIWRTAGCCSHFVLKNGSIHWYSCGVKPPSTV